MSRRGSPRAARPSDGAAELAAAWEEHRAGGLPHVQLPRTVGGVAEGAARELFERLVADRAGSGDPMVNWVETLTEGR